MLPFRCSFVSLTLTKYTCTTRSARLNCARLADGEGRLDRHRVVLLLAFYRFPLQEDTVSLAHCANSDFAASAISGVVKALCEGVEGEATINLFKEKNEYEG